MEAVNNGADVMNQAKTGSESTLFNSFYNTFGPNQFVMNPSMSDPLKAIDLPTLYAMAEEAVGQEANKIQAEIVSRQDAMQNNAGRPRPAETNPTQQGAGTTTPRQSRTEWQPTKHSKLQLLNTSSTKG